MYRNSNLSLLIAILILCCRGLGKYGYEPIRPTEALVFVTTHNKSNGMISTSMRRNLIRDMTSYQRLAFRKRSGSESISCNNIIFRRLLYTQISCYPSWKDDMFVRPSSKAKLISTQRKKYIIHSKNGINNCCLPSRLFSSTLSEIPKDDIQSGELAKMYQELKQLSTEIQNHDTLYYTPGLSPVITDDEYDALTKREAEICQLYPSLQQKLEIESGLGSKATRYGGRVGPILIDNDNEILNIAEKEKLDLKAKDSSTQRSRKIIHLENAPMQSLDNAMDVDEVVKWLNRVRKILMKGSPEDNIETSELQAVNKNVVIVAEPKMDGLSLSLRYKLMKNDELGEHYILVSGATRGDGRRGEDITIAIKNIAKTKGDVSSIIHPLGKIPLTFSLQKKSFSKNNNIDPEVIEIRGEVVLPKTTFNELVKAAHEEQVPSEEDDSKNVGSLLQSQLFSNARNAASGILLRRKSEADLTEAEVETTKRLRSSLRFYAYSMACSTDVSEDETDSCYSNGEELRDVLTSFGFSVPNPSLVTTISLNPETEVSESDCKELVNYHEKIMANREKVEDKNILFDFDIDGAVYKVSSIEDRTILGESISIHPFVKPSICNSHVSFYAV